MSNYDIDYEALQAELEQLLMYKFNNPTLLFDALYAAVPTERLPEANKPLAQLGDLAFRALVGTMCFNAQCGKSTTSDQLQSVGSNSHFAKVGRSHDLDAYVILQNGCIGGVSDGLMATALKAIIGAVWQDSKASLNAIARVSHMLGLGVFAPIE